MTECSVALTGSAEGAPLVPQVRERSPTQVVTTAFTAALPTRDLEARRSSIHDDVLNPARAVDAVFTPHLHQRQAQRQEVGGDVLQSRGGVLPLPALGARRVRISQAQWMLRCPRSRETTWRVTGENTAPQRCTPKALVRLLSMQRLQSCSPSLATDSVPTPCRLWTTHRPAHGPSRGAHPPRAGGSSPQFAESTGMALFLRGDRVWCACLNNSGCAVSSPSSVAQLGSSGPWRTLCELV
jgi:hypothetical protein